MINDEEFFQSLYRELKYCSTGENIIDDGCRRWIWYIYLIFQISCILLLFISSLLIHYHSFIIHNHSIINRHQTLIIIIIIIIHNHYPSSLIICHCSLNIHHQSYYFCFLGDLIEKITGTSILLQLLLFLSSSSS